MLPQFIESLVNGIMGYVISTETQKYYKIKYAKWFRYLYPYENFIVDLSVDTLNNMSNEDIRHLFYDKFGCLIVRNVFAKEDMDEYNLWCETHISDVIKNHDNSIHPKQKDKIIINDVMERMSCDNPRLLLKLINNAYINRVLDALLGFACIGAATTHWIKPGGDRQQTHVDFPCHVKSGKFWQDNPMALDKYFTSYQLNNILSHYSVQTLIASDAMNGYNGSTEIVPASHLIKDIDREVHYMDFPDSLFINADLSQGDALFFNRRTVHRGGRNNSSLRRNSLILQSIWLFGVGQHKTDSNVILNNLKDTMLTEMTVEQAHDLTIRIKQPYPINTIKHT